MSSIMVFLYSLLYFLSSVGSPTRKAIDKKEMFVTENSSGLLISF